MFLGEMATFYCYRKAKKILLIFTPAYLTALKSTFKGYPPLFTIDLLATQIGYTATYGRAGQGYEHFFVLTEHLSYQSGESLAEPVHQFHLHFY